MRTEVMRGLALIVTTLIVAGCGPQPEPFPAPTPEELKQLTDVTDRVMLLLRSPDHEPLGAAIAALSAADRQYRQHADAVRSKENVDALVCIHANVFGVLDIESSLAKRDEGHIAIFRMLASEAGHCAAVSVDRLIDREARPQAIQHGAVLISEIFAIWAIHKAATDLPLPSLLKEQIRVYESIAAKLGPEHAAPVVTDALPKLRATLASLETKPER